MSGGKIGHSAEMNERPKLGTGEGGVNDRFWVYEQARIVVSPKARSRGYWDQVQTAS